MTTAVAFMDEQQRLTGRLNELEQIRLIALGQVSERETELADAKVLVARAEGAIGETHDALARYTDIGPEEEE